MHHSQSGRVADGHRMTRGPQSNTCFRFSPDFSHLLDLPFKWSFDKNSWTLELCGLAQEWGETLVGEIQKGGVISSGYATIALIFSVLSGVLLVLVPSSYTSLWCSIYSRVHFSKPLNLLFWMRILTNVICCTSQGGGVVINSEFSVEATLLWFVAWCPWDWSVGWIH